MTHYDVFNGDADGILSLVQLRKAEPKESVLISGVKRDINLLKQVPIDGSPKSITVLDISMEKNSEALLSQLDTGSEVFYVDHHRSGTIPISEQLQSIINLDPNVCTAVLVDEFLNGTQRLWAITAAYGDNMIGTADKLAKIESLSLNQSEQLKEFGILVNYNGYGESIDDLTISPSALFVELMQYDTPFECIADNGSIFHTLQKAYKQDMQSAQSAKIISDTELVYALELEDAAWARRISGVYGNQLANENKDKAILVLTKNADETLRVSLRAPINNKQGAGDICAKFATGGGRAAAAGINHLPNEDLNKLIETVTDYYKSEL